MKLCAILLLLVSAATGLALRSYSSVSVRPHTQENAHTLQTLTLAKQTLQGTGTRAMAGRGRRDGTMLSMGSGMGMDMDMGMGMGMGMG
eukprot:CAMPEP_0173236616 /NCGR_PEP_ID=MMETSP1142-20121109/11550_1 /TAXON_ID=483371 /ORGANISM="non described non described, Strain CCMP2298" /LENGTH=88 /DNA_ID=CAMNT_0014167127 /DNA_START=95 /DNA_END=357 /DNA_ORIENTATION=+